MKTKDLIDAIADNTGFKKKDLEKILGGMISFIIKNVERGEKVKITGFGEFTTSKRSARIAKNPKTGQIINVPELRTVKFKPTKAFKQAVKKPL